MAKVHAVSVLLIFSTTIACIQGYDQLDSFANSLLQEVISRMGDRGVVLPGDYETSPLREYSLNPNSGQHLQSPELSDEDVHLKQKALNARVAKEYDGHDFRQRHDNLLGREPAIRDQEYLEHSSLFGHQYVQGGAGEGFQRLKPDGSIKNMQVIKTDGVLPAYCNPPNPCPLGYSSNDGCLEDFVNTAAFSREYQASQECMCDTEHMFDCPGATKENEIDALARSIQNEGIMDSTLNRLVENMQIEGQHKNLVAKKFFSSKPTNPYLDGEKLPVVAKKAPVV